MIGQFRASLGAPNGANSFDPISVKGKEDRLKTFALVHSLFVGMTGQLLDDARAVKG